MTILLFLKDNNVYKTTLSLVVSVTMALVVGTLFKGSKTSASSTASSGIIPIPNFNFSIGGGLMGFVLTFLCCFIFLVRPDLGEWILTKSVNTAAEKTLETRPVETEETKQVESVSEVVPPPAVQAPKVEVPDRVVNESVAKASQEEKEWMENYKKSLNLDGPKNSGY